MTTGQSHRDRDARTHLRCLRFAVALSCLCALLPRCAAAQTPVEFPTTTIFSSERDAEPTTHIVREDKPLTREDDLDQVILLASQATRAAAESIPRAKGAGTFEHRVTKIVDGKPKETVVGRGAFRMAFADGKDFLLLEFTSSDEQHDAEIFVDDGKVIMQSVFSPKIHPHGAKGWIHQRVDEGGHRSLFGPAPHYLARAWAFVDRISKYPPEVTKALHREEDLLVIRLTFEGKGQRMDFFVDPQQEYHIVRFENVGADGKMKLRVHKKWARTDSGLWYVERYEQQAWPEKVDERRNGWRYEFTSYEPNVEISPDEFTVDSIGLPYGARIMDVSK